MLRIEEISGVTNEEWIRLKCTAHALEDPRFLCSECLSKGSHLPDYEIRNNALRSSKACFSIEPVQYHHIDNEIGFRTCIGNFFSHACHKWLTLYDNYTRGVLPYPGSAMEQPAKAMEIFSIIEDIHIKKQIKDLEAKRLQQKAGKNAR